jgi:hypothetical protein
MAYLLKMAKVAYEGASAALLEGYRIREIFLLAMDWYNFVCACAE